VLVVDREASIRETLRTLLEEDGYTVLEAATGLAALNLLRADARRLVVLLDHSPPQLDGVGLLRQIAHDRRLKQRHAFILMTAHRLSTRLAVLRFLALLRVPMLRKPFDIAEVEEVVARMVLSFGVSAG
jgi:CheY-like chemotaxis protein